MIAVHFGAGNIGRGFIGELLNRSGYEVVFVDVNQELVDEINRRKEYTVLFADEDQKTLLVQGVRALHGQDEDVVARTIAHADLVTTAVGPTVLKVIAPVIRDGILQRIQENQQPLNVIACENMIGASTKLKEYIYEPLSEEERRKADEWIGFPDAAVDRIVPLQKNDDKLLVAVEPFYEWVVDQTKIVGNIPRIEGVTYVNDLIPYIERKLFTVNTGHAITAYLGYLYGHSTIEEAIGNPHILEITKKALNETGALLIAKYQFDSQQHQEYINKILKRFQNPHLSDEVTRVGRSPIRKLSPQDRLVRPAVQAFDYDIIPSHLSIGIAAALLFDYPNDPEAMEIQESLKEKGLEKTLENYTGIETKHPLFQMVMDQVNILKEIRNKNYE
jgi:mannitol-1-phosphate 5-dehydrogenase